ncbi:hypothetical protein E0T48_002724 [Enterococcus faecalis]|nr:type II toxin-antitoxin system HicA family toxin [Enterococcus faecalis]EHK9982445.1 hypothetical protein [Enterococcus faecalis]HAP3815484.1 type II toxin-antitoxin system HicA family toxin [Enterococcus faecalis]HAP3825332.1 type II toxin-antitoxin system HicA family toxin [Enterococcus faecalis]
MPSWKELERFLKNDGWSHITNKSGRDKWYEKRLANGDLLQSRVSKGSGEIGKTQFKVILKQQLKCNLTYFNKVKNKRPKDSNRYPNQ